MDELATATHAVPFEKFGRRYIHDGKLEPRILNPAPGFDVADVLCGERGVTRSLDRLARHQAIEIPGTRHGEWEYREHAYTVDPWEILAYVGDRTGAEAVQASNEFLASAGRAFTQGLTAVQFDVPEPSDG